MLAVLILIFMGFETLVSVPVSLSLTFITSQVRLTISISQGCRHWEDGRIMSCSLSGIYQVFNTQSSFSPLLPSPLELA